jgi:hypothetical protein
MPREHIVKVYRYSELSDEAKEKARMDWIDKGHAWDPGYDSDMLTQNFKEILQEKGFEKDVEVFWSLGNNQGDGVAFSGSLDIAKYIRENKLAQKFMKLVGHIYATVKHSGRYAHRNSMEVIVGEEETDARSIGPKDWFPGKPTSELIKEFQSDLEEDVKDISRELEKIGYAEIEYRQSEEYIADMFEANDFEFTEDGRRFRS